MLWVLESDYLDQVLEVVRGEDDRVELDPRSGLALQVGREVYHVGYHDYTYGLDCYLDPLQDIVDEGLVGEALVDLVEYYQLDGLIARVLGVGEEVGQQLLGFFVFFVEEVLQDCGVHLFYVQVTQAVYIQHLELWIHFLQILEHLSNHRSLPTARTAMQTQWTLLALFQIFHKLAHLLHLFSPAGHPLVQMLLQG